ncbi:hypothetical protein ACFP81_06630 [Deinococcus lacus]|uniref:Uncharacterized protein n=1 Tax=Deinococcus lacus TaxID=392561 RepID=A0ABW1YBU9_9DEIO
MTPQQRGKGFFRVHFYEQGANFIDSKSFRLGEVSGQSKAVLAAWPGSSQDEPASEKPAPLALAGGSPQPLEVQGETGVTYLHFPDATPEEAVKLVQGIARSQRTD